MAAPHGKLFAAIVVGGAAFGSGCYLSHELASRDAGRDLSVADAGRDLGTDAGADAGTDLGTDAGGDAGCPIPGADGRVDCAQCVALCGICSACSVSFCCFI